MSTVTEARRKRDALRRILDAVADGSLDVETAEDALRSFAKQDFKPEALRISPPSSQPIPGGARHPNAGCMY